MPGCSRCSPTSMSRTTRPTIPHRRHRAHLLRGDDRRDARSRRHAARGVPPRRHHARPGGPCASAAIDRRRRRAERSRCPGVASNDGRDQSAFLIGCRDILLGDDYDLVVKIHSKKTAQDGYNVGRHFKRSSSENLLEQPRLHREPAGALPEGADGSASSTRRRSTSATPRWGAAGGRTSRGFEVLAEQLGIRVPLDDDLAPRAVRVDVRRPPRGAATARRARLDLRAVRRRGGVSRRRTRSRPRADALVRGR